MFLPNLMKKLLILILAFNLFAAEQKAQSVNHWETIVTGTDVWKFIVPTSQPASNWNDTSFNAASWNSGAGSIGYGDGDDNTIIAPAISVYLRQEFSAIDTSKILMAVLHADYDDAFVAYLNGVEIARANIGTVGVPPPYNQAAASVYEAQLYQGNPPPSFTLDKQLLSTLLVPGTNVLSAEVHNYSAFSPDMTSLFYLSVAISDSSFTYDSLPPWFYAPMTSSNLPIIVINTNGQTILDDPRIVVDMGIIYNGPGMLNYLTDPFNDYDGLVNIEIRGSSSQMFPKKSYSFETQDTANIEIDVSLLGLPAENDWVLYAPYDDKTFLRDALAYKMGREMGRYASRTVFTELILNGEYQGIYILEEKIKRDANRVDIAKLTPADTVGNDLTGGYILKIDKTTGGGNYWQSAYPTIGSSYYVRFQYHYPDYIDMMPQQVSYIQDFMYDAEAALNATWFTNPDSGYRKYMDPSTFIDFFIVNEIARNVDGYRISTFFYKDKDSNDPRLKMGPLWDFNITMGNADYCQAMYTYGWAYMLNQACPNSSLPVPFWWYRFLQDPLYTAELRCRWDSLRQTVLATPYILAYLDSMALALDDAQVRNYQRWPILGIYVWPNYFIGNTYQEEIDYLKTWLTNRLTWMDNNLPGNCALLAINETENNSAIKVFPNPSNGDKITVTGNFQKPSVELFDVFGKAIAIKHFSSGNNIELNLSDFPQGIYFLKIADVDKVFTSKLIISR